MWCSRPPLGSFTQLRCEVTVKTRDFASFGCEARKLHRHGDEKRLNARSPSGASGALIEASIRDR